MKRNKHSLSHYKLTTFDMGELVPIGWYEALPGDTIQQATSALLRCTPLVTPIMHPVHVRIHHWFVPNRIIWDHWENFITGGPDGMDATVPPTINVAAPTVGSLHDYLGVPNGITAAVSALPYRAYAMIFNEFYRDQDLTAALGMSTGDGNDTTTNTSLVNCAWEKDYFTSARPWAQKGPSVTIPLGTSATVRTSSSQLVTGAQPAGRWLQSAAGAAPATGFNVVIPAGTDALTNSNTANATSQGSGLYPSNLFADLSNASAVTVNVLREALALQRYEEARARYGSRYVEYLRYLGVKSSDARLQRPEYLGGGKQTIQFSEVLSTADGGAGLPIGSLKGHGIGAMRSNRYRRFFEEHGIVMTLMSVRPRTMYTQGLPRKWNRQTREDYWQKEFEHIGQQTILNKEIYAAHASPTGTFGYQDRYDEYRRSESEVSGLMRTTDNIWHMARIFGSSPALNSSFVVSDPTKRTFADTTSDGLIVMANHSIQARRMVAATGSSFIY